jgi:hypothetical protein
LKIIENEFLMKKRQSATTLPSEVDAEAPWRRTAQLILLSEMGRALVRPAELADRLGMESAQATRNKINRATFSAGWFLLALQALGVESIRIPDEPMQVPKTRRASPRKARLSSES